jgi:putative transposase
VTVDFKGARYPKWVILHAVFLYVRYAVSYRDLEEILAERGVKVDHTTLNRSLSGILRMPCRAMGW